MGSRDSTLSVAASRSRGKGGNLTVKPGLMSDWLMSVMTVSSALLQQFFPLCLAARPLTYFLSPILTVLFLGCPAVLWIRLIPYAKTLSDSGSF
ncbi:hypothetical protein IWW34DRAFT_754164 [Fusarium oxysporum f. sp. albedinis]|nr:hypothetical protein IWW34DRAFT_754164 [Fusarium oxysporum f. sp. albedinis]